MEKNFINYLHLAVSFCENIQSVW